MTLKLKHNSKCAVIGYGSWGTAIAKILLENEPSIGWHITNNHVSEHIIKSNTNPKYLSSVQFDPSRVDISSSIDEVVSGADIIIFATPSAFLEKTLEPLTCSLKDKFILSAIKGIVTKDNLTIAEYFNRYFDIPYDNIGVVTGPCHAEEVALERLSYLNLVSKDQENGVVLAQKFATPYIKTNILSDLYGTEYAAVLKNIYAIAVGICHGLGYGDNFISVLITNAAREMKYFLDSTYEYVRDTNTSAYLGDLLVTSYSQFSRNRSFGNMIGKGYSVKSAQIEMSMIAEGYYASLCINDINKIHKLEMPIADAVYKILYKEQNPMREIKSLVEKLK